MLDLRDRKAFEQAIRAAFVGVGKDYVDRMIALLGDPPHPNNIPLAFWNKFGISLAARWQPVLNDIYLTAAKNTLAHDPIGIQWGLVNQRAADWSNTYAFDLVKKINVSTQNQLQQTIQDFFTQQRTVGATREEIQRYIPDLITKSGRLLTSEQRAKLIATTEVTRASVEGDRAIIDQVEAAGIRMLAIWETQRDAKVCPLCAPRQGEVKGDGWTEPPPAHPGCFCDLRYEPASIYERHHA